MTREQAVAVSLQELAGRARPVALAGERVLPVAEALQPLLPEGGLRRGSVVGVSGSKSVALALAAAASEAGSWCAAVVGGQPSLGLLAAAEAGIALERFPVVTVPERAGAGSSFSWAVAALLDGFDVVLVWPPVPLRAAEARTLAARARERRSVLIVDGPGWPAAADLRFEAARAAWHGVGRGHGRLESRQLDITVTGRGAAARPRRATVWV